MQGSWLWLVGGMGDVRLGIACVSCRAGWAGRGGVGLRGQLTTGGSLGATACDSPREQAPAYRCDLPLRIIFQPYLFVPAVPCCAVPCCTMHAVP